MASESAASTAFQLVTNWPRKSCAPSVTVLVPSDGARISGNHRSFQIGIMVKTATVAMAGRTSGSTRRKKIVYSDRPSILPAFFRSSDTCFMNSDRMKMASGRPCAV